MGGWLPYNLLIVINLLFIHSFGSLRYPTKMAGYVVE
jgi:hypothetical protein